jgi:hypothetical protein
MTNGEAIYGIACYFDARNVFFDNWRIPVFKQA